MTGLCKSILTLILLTSTQIIGQTRKPVELIAFYHLDSLTKVDTSIKYFHYLFNGYVENYKVIKFDTIGMNPSEDKYFLKSRFNDLFVFEDSTIQKVHFPGKMRVYGSKYPMSLCRHLKVKDHYYVKFQIENDHGGIYLIMVLDSSGNLRRRHLGNFVY